MVLETHLLEAKRLKVLLIFSVSPVGFSALQSGQGIISSWVLYLYALMNQMLRIYHNFVVATPYIIDLDCMSYVITFIIVGYLMMRGSV